MEKKKHLILLVLKLLETETNANHPITQTEIAKTISEVYPCDRKTVGRNIKDLKELGYPIMKTTKGFYMDEKRFTVDEIDFVINAIITASGMRVEDKEALANNVKDVLSRRYSNK